MENFNYLNFEPRQEEMQQWRNDFNVEEIDRMISNHQVYLEPMVQLNTGTVSRYGPDEVNFANNQMSAENMSLQAPMGPQGSGIPLNNSWNVQGGTNKDCISTKVHDIVNMDLVTRGIGHCDSDVPGNDNDNLCLSQPIKDFGDHCDFNDWLRNFDQQQAVELMVPPHQYPPVVIHASQGHSDSLLNTINALPTSLTITSGHPPTPGLEDQMMQYHVATTSFLQETGGMTNYTRSYIPNTVEQASRDDIPINIDGDVGFLQANSASTQLESTLQPLNPTRISGWSPIAPQQNSFPSYTPNTSFEVRPYFEQPAETFAFSLPVAKNDQNTSIERNPMFVPKVSPLLPDYNIIRPLRTRNPIEDRQPVLHGTNILNYSNNLSLFLDNTRINIPVIKERGRSRSNNENRRKQKLEVIPGNFEIFILNDNGETLVDIATPEKLPSGKLSEEQLLKQQDTKSAMDDFSETIPVKLGENMESNRKLNCTRSKELPEDTKKTGCSSLKINEKIHSQIAINKAVVFQSSDSVTSEDEPVEKTITAKSLKCEICRKLFKSGRTLKIHAKRCTVSVSTKSASPCIELPEQQSAKRTRRQFDEAIDSNKRGEGLEVHGSRNERPFTRSQTRLSTKSPKK